MGLPPWHNLISPPLLKLIAYQPLKTHRSDFFFCSSIINLTVLKFAKYTHNMFNGNTVITAYNQFSMEFVWDNVKSLDVQQTYHFHKKYLRPSLHHHQALHLSIVQDDILIFPAAYITTSSIALTCGIFAG